MLKARPLTSKGERQPEGDGFARAIRLATLANLCKIDVFLSSASSEWNKGKIQFPIVSTGVMKSKSSGCPIKSSSHNIFFHCVARPVPGQWPGLIVALLVVERAGNLGALPPADAMNSELL